MADLSQLRVADADREQLAEELREHMLAGRLTPAEFEERVGRAYAATTRGQLDELRADLPMSPATLERALAERKATLRRRLVQEGGGGLTASAVCVVIWLAAGAQGAFWPVWVIVFALLSLLRDGWRLLGPAPDLDSVEASLRRRAAHRSRRESGRSRRRELPR